MELTLDEILDTILEVPIRKRNFENDNEQTGLYDPAGPTIYFDPRHMKDVDEFYITILHEIAHHVIDDYEPDELFIEEVARNTYERHDVQQYLKERFKHTVKRYF